MNAPSPSGGRPPAAHREGGQPATGPGDSRDPWPREFGRDGVSGLLTLDRAMRARDVSRPSLEDERIAAEMLSSLLARVDGRRTGPNARAR